MGDGHWQRCTQETADEAIIIKAHQEGYSHLGDVYN
jgi:hypothetical protein